MDDEILIFGINIPNTADNQMTIHVPVVPNVCFCTTWEKQNKQNNDFYAQQQLLL